MRIERISSICWQSCVVISQGNMPFARLVPSLADLNDHLRICELVQEPELLSELRASSHEAVAGSTLVDVAVASQHVQVLGGRGHDVGSLQSEIIDVVSVSGKFSCHTRGTCARHAHLHRRRRLLVLAAVRRDQLSAVVRCIWRKHRLCCLTASSSNASIFTISCVTWLTQATSTLDTLWQRAAAVSPPAEGLCTVQRQILQNHAVAHSAVCGSACTRRHRTN